MINDFDLWCRSLQSAESTARWLSNLRENSNEQRLAPKVR